MLGEVRVQVSSGVAQRFAPGDVLYVGDSRLQVQRRRAVPRGLLVKFHDWDSRDAVQALSGQQVYVREKAVPPPPKDTYYHYQVLGMRVITIEGEEVGVVADILATGANDVYVVKGDGKEILVPALADVVLEVSVEHRRMVVDLPEGL